MNVRKIQKCRLWLWPMVSVGFLSTCLACSNEIAILPEPDASAPGKEPHIYISGGGNDDLTAETKGWVGPGDNDEPDDAPKLDGVCRANRMKIFSYRLNKSGPYENEFKLVKEEQIKELKFAKNDRWVQHSYDFTSDGGSYNWLSFATFAYNEKDIADFTVSPGDNRTTPSLSLSSNMGYHTPEVYCGIVVFNPGDGGLGYTTSQINDNGAIGFYDLAGADNLSAPLYGRLYRIVSQLNVKITDIPVDEVNKLELYMYNYPTKITLHGTHGKYYPVTAVTDPTATTGIGADVAPVLLAASGQITTGTVTLSSFLLPSEIGAYLRLRVTYKGGTTKEFNIQPAKSYFLTGTDAAVYSVNSADLKNGNDLYVYDGRKGKYCFYSYSNVRVNLSGKFENYATDTSESDIVIEVEPNFEKKHDFPII